LALQAIITSLSKFVFRYIKNLVKQKISVVESKTGVYFLGSRSPHTPGQGHAWTVKVQYRYGYGSELKHSFVPKELVSP
jgi:hypothetical protein